MARVTSKLQVTVPKVIADRYGIKPGDEIDWVAAGEVIRVAKRTSGARPTGGTTAERLRSFDDATERQRRRQSPASAAPADATDRGWTREELYRRGSPR